MCSRACGCCRRGCVQADKNNRRDGQQHTSNAVAKRTTSVAAIQEPKSSNDKRRRGSTRRWKTNECGGRMVGGRSTIEGYTTTSRRSSPCKAAIRAREMLSNRGRTEGRWHREARAVGHLFLPHPSPGVTLRRKERSETDRTWRAPLLVVATMCEKGQTKWNTYANLQKLRHITVTIRVIYAGKTVPPRFICAE